MSSLGPSQQRTVAIIGAGQTGIAAALGFLNAGFDVTVLSDRDQISLRTDIPATGTAVTFAASQAAERELGLDDYAGRVPLVTGQSTQIFTGVGGNRQDLLDFDTTYLDGARAIGVDTRLKVDERLREFTSRGGHFVISQVTADSLDEIAASHDLTLVATGRGGLSGSFPVDESRTVYDSPQRTLLMVTLTGLEHGSDVFAHRSPVGGEHNTFAVSEEQGELWWGPYLHKDAGPSWSFLGFAKRGSDWEKRFSAAQDAASAHRIVLDVHRDYVDWDLPEVSATRVIEEDPHAWLLGAVTPTVRHAVGVTKSGHPVLALGDTAISFDPIAAQGAQGGLIQSAQLVAAARDYDGPFDEQWLRGTFEHFWESRGRAATLVTRLFLGDAELAHYSQLFFAAAASSPRFASALFGLISDPTPLLGIDTEEAARDWVAGIAGEPVDDLLARSAASGFRYSTYTPQGAEQHSVAQA
ncbi:styrene monooxygenase/indole monooxygenase family protein [Mycolicibacterium komossense]|uniref:Cadherin repeat domain-containing protein n=1 Tax=Mycolicibacterium komossense TaxID=1779 RepID=A0ABT3C5T4_9MYCO|nr:styrene monooxygenase/indole monooxygenase family protein [Mycolicibacterium komossense]MCV7224823.1 cadherin repeat domain-containing protein [Mycolicibacterium komossense]